MKNLILTICFSAAFYFSTTAQVDIQVNPILLLFKKFQVSIEAPIGKRVGVEINYLDKDIYGPSIFYGIGKYYTKPKYGNDEFYVAGYYNYSPNSPESLNNVTGGGFAMGYKVLYSTRINFEAAIGLGTAYYFKFSVGYRFGG